MAHALRCRRSRMPSPARACRSGCSRRSTAGVVVVALLQPRDDAVPALLGDAFGARVRTGPAGLEHAGRAAAVQARRCFRRRTARCPPPPSRRTSPWTRRADPASGRRRAARSGKRRRNRRPAVVLPSSQPSPASSLPLPQTAIGTQSLPGVGQLKPGSATQVAEQPSFEAVLPSSHCSRPATMPSPQVFGGTLVQGPPVGGAGIARFDLRTVGRAAVARARVAVVAGLARIDLAVAADPDRHAGLAGVRTDVAGFESADRPSSRRRACRCRRRRSRPCSAGRSSHRSTRSSRRAWFGVGQM